MPLDVPAGLMKRRVCGVTSMVKAAGTEWVERQGNFGNFLKLGLRFSKKACLPSWASSVK